MVYCAFLIFGISCLLPWSAVVSALDFFIISYPNYNPAFVFGFALNLPSVIFAFLNIFIAKHIPQNIRIVSGLLCLFWCVILLPFTAQYVEESVSWYIILGIIGITGIAVSFTQGGLLGFAGVFPPKYTNAVMLGQGLAGLSMITIRMVNLAFFPPEEVQTNDNKAFIGSLIYFTIASLILVLWIIGYFWVRKTRFARYHMKKAGNKSVEYSLTFEYGALSVVSFINPHILTNLSRDVSDDQELSMEFNNVTKISNTLSSVYSQIWPMALQVMLWYTITLTVFPGTQLSTSLSFLGGDKNKNYVNAWFSVIMVLLFNLFDTFGRLVPAWVISFNPGSIWKRLVIVLSIFRFIFIPTSIMIQLNLGPSYIFQSDWFKMLNMMIFSFTSGFTTTLLMVFGPSSVSHEDKEKAGFIMGAHLIGGIFLGSLIASSVMTLI